MVEMSQRKSENNCAVLNPLNSPSELYFQTQGNSNKILIGPKAEWFVIWLVLATDFWIYRDRLDPLDYQHFA